MYAIIAAERSASVNKYIFPFYNSVIFLDQLIHSFSNPSTSFSALINYFLHRSISDSSFSFLSFAFSNPASSPAILVIICINSSFVNFKLDSAISSFSSASHNASLLGLIIYNFSYISTTVFTKLAIFPAAYETLLIASISNKGSYYKSFNYKISAGEVLLISSVFIASIKESI